MADNNSEILALLAEQMRAADRDREAANRDRQRADQDREDNMRRFEDIGRNFERLTEVMIAGFGRLEDKITAVKEEVAGVKQEVAALGQRVDTLTDEQRALNRRLQATFEQTGQLTEQAADADLRLTRTEQQAVPTNAELDARLREVENRLRNAS